jgi:hypothetical protein
MFLGRQKTDDEERNQELSHSLIVRGVLSGRQRIAVRFNDAGRRLIMGSSFWAWQIGVSVQVDVRWR